MQNKLKAIISWALSSKLKLAITIIVLIGTAYLGYKNLLQPKPQPNYQTAQAAKGTLVQSVSASGQITNANNVQITIQASGVVKEVLVQNGDSVSQGQTLATLTLDQASQQKQAAAYASYTLAKANLDTAQAKLNSLQSAEFKANQKLINDAVARGLATNDPTYIQENADWLQSEADYKNQQGQITQAEAALNSASIALSQTTSVVTAPASGVIKGLTIASGSVISLTSSSVSSPSTSQVLGSIYQSGPIQAQVNISEIDSVKVNPGQKATLTLDAFPNLTFTGQLSSINTNGVVSSGVTTYPALISLDSENDHIYPNMAVDAKIITNVKSDVILVPIAAVQTTSGQSTVRVLKNGRITLVNVETGDSNDTQIEIKSGLKEGDLMVTGISNNSRNRTQSGSSPFGGGGGFGGAFRVIGGGRGG